jgi:ABC-type dipeptide/oligopeptide/nickel transport system permease component
MVTLILRRLLITIPIALVVFTLIFLLVRVAPGDPAVSVLGDNASKEAVEALRIKMGLDKPIWHQYLTSLIGFFKGDFGRSMLSGAPVILQVKTALPSTLQLTFGAIILGLAFGIPLGILTAVYRNGVLDYVGRVLSLAGLSIPSFFLGILLMLLFCIYLPWFPIVGGGDGSNWGNMLYHLFLPALTLGLIMMAYVTRVTRSAMLNTMREDYIRTARSKGLVEIRVILSHAFRNALVPVVSITGVNVIVLISSSIMIEIIFSRPGLGKLLVGAMKQSDYITLQSVMVVYAFLVILINLITDLMYEIVDPRIRYE